MIAGVDPRVDLADQETEAAAVAESLATRNSPPSGRQLEPQAPQAREPRGDRSAGIRSATRELGDFLSAPRILTIQVSAETLFDIPHEQQAGILHALL